MLAACTAAISGGGSAAPPPVCLPDAIATRVGEEVDRVLVAGLLKLCPGTTPQAAPPGGGVDPALAVLLTNSADQLVTLK